MIRYITITTAFYKLTHYEDSITLYVDSEGIQQFLASVYKHGKARLEEFVDIPDVDLLDFYFLKLDPRVEHRLCSMHESVLDESYMPSTCKKRFFISFDLEERKVRFENEDDYGKAE